MFLFKLKVERFYQPGDNEKIIGFYQIYKIYKDDKYVGMTQRINGIYKLFNTKEWIYGMYTEYMEEEDQFVLACALLSGPYKYAIS